MSGRRRQMVARTLFALVAMVTAGSFTRCVSAASADASATDVLVDPGGAHAEHARAEHTSHTGDGAEQAAHHGSPACAGATGCASAITDGTSTVSESVPDARLRDHPQQSAGRDADRPEPPVPKPLPAP